MYQYKVNAFCKWCQHYPPEKLAVTLKQAGFDGIDLPCRASAPFTHVNAPEKLPSAARIFAMHGIPLASLVTDLRQGDAEAEKLLETAAALGVKNVRIDGYPLGDYDINRLYDEAASNLESLQKLLARYNVKGAIQVHSGDALECNISSTLHLLRNFDPQWLGIQYDPGHLTISGESIKMALRLMGEYLHTVNLKSPRSEYFISPETRRLTYKPVWVPLRDGMLDVPALLAALDRHGYRGPLNIHAEYRTHYYKIDSNPEAVDKIVAEDVNCVRSIMAGCS